MLSAIISATDDALALAETLSALVPAAIQGLVRDAVVVAPIATDPVRELADAAGAAHLIAPGGAIAAWQAAAVSTRSDWALCLDAGMTPTGPWIDDVARFVERAQRDPRLVAAAFTVRSETSVFASVRHRARSMTARLAGRPYPPAGLLIRRETLVALPRRLRTDAMVSVLLDRRQGT